MSDNTEEKKVKLIRPDWDETWMDAAELMSRRATCLRRKVGAVLVKDNQLISSGFNGASKGVTHCDERGCIRQEKKIPSGQMHEICWGVHAEQNAIIQAGYDRSKGGILYVTVSPCFICAKMIVNAGIVEVVYQGQYPDEMSKELLDEAHVKTRVYVKK